MAGLTVRASLEYDPSADDVLTERLVEMARARVGIMDELSMFRDDATADFDLSNYGPKIVFSFSLGWSVDDELSRDQATAEESIMDDILQQELQVFKSVLGHFLTGHVNVTPCVGDKWQLKQFREFDAEEQGFVPDHDKSDDWDAGELRELNK